MRVLPRRQADLAIRYSRFPDSECASFEEAMNSFLWGGTPEGPAFWSELTNKFADILAQMPAGFSPLRGPVRNSSRRRSPDIIAYHDDEWDDVTHWMGDTHDSLYAVRVGSEIAIENRIGAAPPVFTMPSHRQPLAEDVVVGARYRTRGGQTTGPVLPHDGGLAFRMEPGGRTYRCSDRGECELYVYDLVERAGSMSMAEWLSWVPDGGWALGYMTALGCCQGHSPSEQHETIGDALLHAFIWHRSDEGHEYWRDMHRYLEGRDSAPPVPPAVRVTTPTPVPPPPVPPPPVVKKKYRITEVRHYYIEAEDEIEADNLFRGSRNPAVEFSVFAEDREINEA